MKTSISVGPILGFESGDFYTVCILTDGLTAAPQLEVASGKIPFVPLEMVGASQFWRAEFQTKISDGATGTMVTYSIRAADGNLLSDRHALAQWAFYVPGAAEH